MSQTRPESVPIDGRGRRVAVVVGRFNADITERLLEGARTYLNEIGLASGDIRVVYVPGAFEIPLVAQKVLNKGGIDGVIALGAIIRGGTPHFDYVCDAVTQGCLRVSLDSGTPVAFGVLTCDNDAQAQERANPDASNKGREAAMALMESIISIENL